MQYQSTRGSAPSLGFEDVTLAGLASDGGLYLPTSWPAFSAEQIRALAGLSYVETAVRVMAPFVAGSLSEEELRRMGSTEKPAAFKRWGNLRSELGKKKGRRNKR